MMSNIYIFVILAFSMITDSGMFNLYTFLYRFLRFENYGFFSDSFSSYNRHFLQMYNIVISIIWIIA